MADRLPRKLVAILYADVAGYSRLTGEDEDATHRTLSASLDLISTIIESHHGQVKHYAGDAVLAKFNAIVDAMSAAVAIQNELNQRNENLPDERKILFRVGVNSGDVIEDRGDIYGDGVNVAARLEGLADPGGICISEAVRSAIGKKLDLDYEDLGDQEVKNIADPVRAYKITLTKEAPPRIGSAEPVLKLPDKPSIAVLPFINMSDDPEQEYFSDGITEDITTALSYFSGLFVIARNSAFAYKGKSVDVRQVARELGIRYLLEGSVRRLGRRIRISGQLIDATLGSHIWAERFDGDVDDIFELQDDITRKIVGSIAPRIELAEVDRSRGLQPTNLSSYELSLKAKSQFYDAMRSGDADGVEKAINTAQEALVQDPRNTHALWVLALAQLEQYLYRWGRDPLEALSRGSETAENLIQVDPSNASGHLLRGYAHMFRHEFDLAMADFERALSLNPNSVMNLFVAAWGESLTGHTALAKVHAELGLRLSPREMDFWLGVAYLALTQASFAEEDFEEAMKWGRLSIQMHSKAPIRRSLMVACCAYTGDLEEAVYHAKEIQTFAPDFISSVLRGELELYKMADHNNLLVEGLRKAGLSESTSE